MSENLIGALFNHVELFDPSYFYLEKKSYFFLDLIIWLGEFSKLNPKSDYSLFVGGIFDPYDYWRRNNIILGFNYLFGIIIQIKSKVQILYNSYMEFSKLSPLIFMRFSKISSRREREIICYFIDSLFILFHE